MKTMDWLTSLLICNSSNDENYIVDGYIIVNHLRLMFVPRKNRISRRTIQYSYLSSLSFSHTLKSEQYQPPNLKNYLSSHVPLKNHQPQFLSMVVPQLEPRLNVLQSGDAAKKVGTHPEASPDGWPVPVTWQ